MLTFVIVQESPGSVAETSGASKRILCAGSASYTNGCRLVMLRACKMLTVNVAVEGDTRLSYVRQERVLA